MIPKSIAEKINYKAKFIQGNGASFGQGAEALWNILLEADEKVGSSSLLEAVGFIKTDVHYDADFPLGTILLSHARALALIAARDGRIQELEKRLELWESYNSDPKAELFAAKDRIQELEAELKELQKSMDQSGWCP